MSARVANQRERKTHLRAALNRIWQKYRITKLAVVHRTENINRGVGRLLSIKLCLRAYTHFYKAQVFLPEWIRKNCRTNPKRLRKGATGNRSNRRNLISSKQALIDLWNFSTIRSLFSGRDSDFKSTGRMFESSSGRFFLLISIFSLRSSF